MTTQTIPNTKIIVAVKAAVTSDELTALIADARGEMEAAWDEQSQITVEDNYTARQSELATDHALTCESYYNQLCAIQERRLAEARRLLAAREAGDIAFQLHAVLGHVNPSSQSWVFYGSDRNSRAFELIDHLRINGISFTVINWQRFGIRVSF